MNDNNDYITKQPKLRFSGFDGEYSKTLIKSELNYIQSVKYIENDFVNNKDVGIPILTPNKSFVLGYTNNTKNVFDKTPVIIFDDFTTDMKYVDFKFKVKSSAIKIIYSNKDNLKYWFYLLNARKPEKFGHKRHWISSTSNETRFLPNIDEQIKIANFLSLLDKQINLYVRKLELMEIKKNSFLKNIKLDIVVNEISENIKIIDGFPFNSSNYLNKGIPIYTISNIGDNEFIETNFNKTNLELDEKYTLKKNDIFCSLTGEKGFKCLLYDKNTKNYFNQRTIKVFSKKIDSKILFLYFNVNTKKINLFATGSQKNISKKDIYKLPTVLNNDENLKKSEIFMNYLNVIKILKIKIKLLNKRKWYYLSNLFI